jgi:uncharacterized protein (TIGR03083 family)
VTYDALEAIRREAAAFRAAAAHGFDAPVPGCPGWTVGDLTFHLGSVYRFHTAHVGRGVTTPPERPEIVDPPDEQLLAWFDEGLDGLLAALAGVAPDRPAWNWAPHTPQVAAFWPRRMALETAVHRWDAQSAYGGQRAVEPVLAADGVDEVLTVMGPAQVSDDLPTGTVVVRAAGLAGAADRAWAVRLAPGSFEVLDRLPDEPDTVVEGPASDLLLVVWGRLPLDEVSVRGDRRPAEALAS